MTTSKEIGPREQATSNTELDVSLTGAPQETNEVLNATNDSLTVHDAGIQAVNFWLSSTSVQIHVAFEASHADSGTSSE